MSYAGLMTTVAPGEIDDFLSYAEVIDDATGWGGAFWMKAVTGYGDKFYRLIVDGRRDKVVYVREGKTEKFSVLYDNEKTTHAVTAVPLGDWDSDAGVDVSWVQEDYASIRGEFADLDISAVMETVEAYGDTAQFSSWSLSGLKRFSTGAPFGERNRQLKLDIKLTNASGTYTLTLSMDGYAIASGSRVGNGSITLSESNSSGVSGSVTIAFTAIIAEGDAYVVARWAKQYTVSIDAGAITATVYDDGRSDTLSVRVGPLSAGSHNYSITPVSDTGISGTAATGSFTIPGRPNSPGVPVYYSGDYTNTRIRFTAASGAPSSHNVYDSALGEAPNFDTAAATAGAGPGTLEVLLPAIAAAAGIRTVVVAAVNGSGVEDGFRLPVEIEYDATGAVVLPRPNIPGYRIKASDGVTLGRTLNVDYSYDAANQRGAATQIKLELINEAGASAISTTVALATPTNGISRGTITLAAASNGWYRPLVRALTVGSIPSSNTTPLEDPRWLADTVLSAPTITARITI